MSPLNPLKVRLAGKIPTTGCWLTLASPASAELLAHCGFDYLVIDAEHGPSENGEVIAQLRAIDAARGNGADVVGVVRVTKNDPSLVKRAMDGGAQTIIFPNVDTVEDAQKAVDSMRFPCAGSSGTRGVAGMVRAGYYGIRRSYLGEANNQACTILMIESKSAVDRIEEIAAVPGVDCLFIGTADLSADMGHLGNPNHPSVSEAVTKVIAVAKKTGVAVGMFATTVTEAKAFREAGASFIALHSDVAWLARGATQALTELNA